MKNLYWIIILVITSVFFQIERNRNAELKNTIKQLYNSLDEISYIERMDCANRIAGERNVYMSNGCYKGLERFCSWTDRPKTCMDKTFPMCQNLDY